MYDRDDLGPEARAWRARREAEARAESDRRRRERLREARLRREHEQARREEQRREEFERRVDEAVAEAEREATLPLRERVRRDMLAGDRPARRSERSPTRPGPVLVRSEGWWHSATSAQVADAARQAGYRSVADYVIEHCPFGSPALHAVRERRGRP